MTPRQRDIYLSLIEGKTNQEIAESLFISKNTVKEHCRNIYNLYKVDNRKQLIAHALKVASSKKQPTFSTPPKEGNKKIICNVK